MGFRLAPRSMTLDDLELHKFEFSVNFSGFRRFRTQQQLNAWRYASIVSGNVVSTSNWSNFWQAFASRGFVSDSWAFLFIFFLATCARLSWSHSAFESMLNSSIVSYRIVFHFTVNLCFSFQIAQVFSSCFDSQCDLATHCLAVWVCFSVHILFIHVCTCCTVIHCLIQWLRFIQR